MHSDAPMVVPDSSVTHSVRHPPVVRKGHIRATMCHPPVVRRGPGSDLFGANRVEQLRAELEELLVQALGELDVGDVVLGVSLV